MFQSQVVGYNSISHIKLQYSDPSLCGSDLELIILFLTLALKSSDSAVVGKKDYIHFPVRLLCDVLFLSVNCWMLTNQGLYNSLGWNNS